MSKNIRATSDGMEYPNANGTQTHVNANTSATTDVYIQLPSSTGTLALSADVPANPYLATYTDSMSAPTTLTGSLQTLAEVTVGTAGVYQLEVSAVAYIEYDPLGMYSGEVLGSLYVVGATDSQLQGAAFNLITAFPEGRGNGYLTNDDGATRLAPHMAYTRDEGQPTWTVDRRNAPRYIPQTCHIYLAAGQVIRYRALNSSAAEDTITMDTCTLTARQIWEAPEQSL